MSTRVWYGGLLLFVLYGAGGACDLCTLTNQITGVSSCSATCGGGQQFYYRYVCCLNLNRSDCESHCNLTLTLTKSIQHFIGCGQECYGGGTFNETTESCLCPQGTTGPCCDLKSQNTSKGSLYVSVGVPLGLISILALVLAIIYVICMKSKRNQRVDAAEGAPGSDEIGTNRYWRDVVKHNDPTL
uniref:Uncharacterized protein LOC111136761 n=1 Tax=Crassostrea virginica TaxID=6565 RepID=A0A8B8EUG7_CRAVI|nr:uncharacterized protein LOC111136761 [Crassostrea virginica]